MKKNHFLFIVVILILTFGSISCQKNNEIQKNKEIAVKYHNLNPDDIEAILSDNFIGRNEKNRFTWNRENHREYLTNGIYKEDSIFYQIAEGDWVATRFFRKGEWKGDTVKYEMMHFKRFENGKIAEIWEYGDTRQVETEEK
jgi:predicted SnoaL-like aldol condensation-catalyzing enzyme